MNLEGRALSLPLLKAQYKRLMKIYHPDINPQGLRRCQEITAAYSLLLSSL
jgi:DnaJ-class molecular chaperone